MAYQKSRIQVQLRSKLPNRLDKNPSSCLLKYKSVIVFYFLVGCINAIKANMELVKNDCLSPATSSQEQVKRQYLSVIIPEEFKDYAYIQVEIVKSKTSFVWNSLIDHFLIYNFEY